MKITLKMLRKKGACDTTEFENLFGTEAEITPENCLKAVENDLDLNWAAGVFFSVPSWKVYEKAKAAAWKSYEKAKAAAFYRASLVEDQCRK